MNFDALEEQLDKKLDEYRGAVFTEDTKTIAKAASLVDFHLFQTSGERPKAVRQYL